MKKSYRVQLNEIHISSWDVEADSESDAIRRTLDGEGELIDCEYSYTSHDDAVHCVTLEL